MAHLTGQPLVGLLGKPEARLSDVTVDHLEALRVDVLRGGACSVEHPLLDQRDEPELRIVGQQLRRQAAPDESWEAGESCRHGVILSGSRLLRTGTSQTYTAS